MVNWNDIVVMQAERYQDFIRDAERERLARRARAASKSAHFYSQALAWLGYRLAMWGRHLQERYSNPSLASESLGRAAAQCCALPVVLTVRGSHQG